MNPKVDWYFEKAEAWKKELEALRRIVLDCGLAEELKWGVPCYTHDGRNVVLIHTFKKYCALLFHKGALLQDEAGLLVQQTQNVQAARQLRFTGLQGISERQALIKAYIFEAIEVEKGGMKVRMKAVSEFPVPEELKQKLEADPELRSAFEALTPGRQRGYLLYFSQPKQAKTRVSRIEKSIPLILDGKGLKDVVG